MNHIKLDWKCIILLGHAEFKQWLANVPCLEMDGCGEKKRKKGFSSVD